MKQTSIAIGTLSLLLSIQVIAAVKPVSATSLSKAPLKNWFDNLLFKDPSMNYEFIRGFGYTYEQGADIGESISTAQKIKPENIDIWYTAWLDVAHRLYLLGQEFYDLGDSVSANGAFLRASNYYRMASFYMDAPENRSKAVSSWEMSQKSFKFAIQATRGIQELEIPYEQTTLHGYFIRAENQNAPLVILNTGYDGTAEELYFVAARAASRRGFNVIFFDGPGQGQSIKRQKIPFRPDWEKVIDPVIQYARTVLSLKTNKIALIGFSMGGYLALRACAFLPEINACVLDPGVDSIAASVLNHFPSNALQLINTDPEKFNAIVKEAMASDLTANWFFNNGFWTFNTTTAADLVKKLKQYRLGDWVKKVKMPTLVIDDASDLFVKQQADEIYQALPQPKKLYRFTAESTAQAHCQVGAQAISNEVIFNWLSKALDYFPIQHQGIKKLN